MSNIFATPSCLVCDKTINRPLQPDEPPFIGGLLCEDGECTQKPWDAHLTCFLGAITKLTLLHHHIGLPEQIAVQPLRLCEINPPDTECRFCDEDIRNIGVDRVITGRDWIKLTRWHAHAGCFTDSLGRVTLYLGEATPRAEVIVNHHEFIAYTPEPA